MPTSRDVELRTVTSDRQHLVERLRRGQDRRSIGEADQVAVEATSDAGVLDDLVILMSHAEPEVAMRAADALEKATRDDTAPLDGHAGVLLSMLGSSEQPEVQWHLAPLVARLELSATQAQEVARQLEGYLEDDSQIVRVNALQSLSDIASDHPLLIARATELVTWHGAQGAPAVRARCRRLLPRLQHRGDELDDPR